MRNINPFTDKSRGIIQKEILIKHRPSIWNQQPILQEYNQEFRSSIPSKNYSNHLEKGGIGVFEKFAVQNSKAEDKAESNRQHFPLDSKYSSSCTHSTKVLRVPKNKVKIFKEVEKESGRKSLQLTHNKTPSDEVGNTNSSTRKDSKQKVKYLEEEKQKSDLSRKLYKRRELEINIHNCKDKFAIEIMAERAIIDIKSRIRSKANQFISNPVTPRRFKYDKVEAQEKKLQEQFGKNSEASTATELFKRKFTLDEGNDIPVATRTHKDANFGYVPEKKNLRKSVAVLKPQEKGSSFLFQKIELNPFKKGASEKSESKEFAVALEELKQKQNKMNSQQVLIRDRLSVLTAEFKSKQDELNFEKKRFSEELFDPLQTNGQMDINFDDSSPNCIEPSLNNPFIREKRCPTESMSEALEELQNAVESKRNSLQAKKSDFREQVNNILGYISKNDRVSVEATYRAENAISDTVRCEVELQKLKEDLNQLEQKTASDSNFRITSSKIGSVNRKYHRCYSDVDKRHKKSNHHKASWISTGVKYGACMLASASVSFALGSCLKKGTGPNI